MKRLIAITFKRVKWGHKYGLSILLFCLISTYFLRDFNWYDNAQYVLGEIVVAVFCYREFYEAVARKKCVWQMCVIVSIYILCCLNILFYLSGWNEKYLEYKYLILIPFLSGTIYYYLKEKGYVNKNS